jgi:predicted alpha-1,6-mannanase (GH76 family)
MTKICIKNVPPRFVGLIIELLAIVFLPFFSPGARAFTPADADAAFAAYTNAFYVTNADGGYFALTTDGGKSHFWERAEELEMVLDTYERTTNPACLAIFTNVYNGFIAQHGANWEQNEFNDDVMWMVIASARANQLTGNASFGAIAKANFDLCYARAWSTNLDGGLWWKTSNQSKNACVNGPGAIAAYLLYQIYDDTNYLSKSRGLFEWERAHLFVPETGKIFDNMTAEGSISYKSFTYNQGTFVGAANFLGYTNDAKLAADFTREQLCWHDILPVYHQDGDAGGFNGICVRWIARFMKQRGLESSYQKWLQTNADAAWSNRRVGDNLAWSRWLEPTPDTNTPLYAWACSSSVVVMQVVPPQRER